MRRPTRDDVRRAVREALKDAALRFAVVAAIVLLQVGITWGTLAAAHPALTR